MIILELDGKIDYYFLNLAKNPQLEIGTENGSQKNKSLWMMIVMTIVVATGISS